MRVNPSVFGGGLGFGMVLLLTFCVPVSVWGLEEVPLRAGAATSNITPELGGEIVGGFQPIPSTHVHDELHARCLVLESGSTRLALVVCDLLGMHRSLCEEACRLIQSSTGIPGSHVLLSATHSHSATSAVGGSPRVFSADLELNDYQRFVARRIADGVARAVNELRPAQWAFGRVQAPEHVFNRRWFLKEGTMPINPFGKTTDRVKMNPPAGSPNLDHPAGDTDPEVCFLAFRETGGRMISIYSAYSLHYVGGVGPGHVSADYYGMYCEALKRLLESERSGDPPFVGIMANGTSGDINNIDFRRPRAAAPAYQQMRFVAEDLAAKVHVGLRDVKWSSAAVLGARELEPGVMWRRISEELLDWAKVLEPNPFRVVPTRSDLPTIYAGRIQRLAAATGPTRARVQVLRVGEVCIGSSPCETFAETGLEFKKRSPFANSFMVELAGGYYGYLPTPRQIELGGYETWPGTNLLEPEASEKILGAALRMAEELKGLR